MESIDRLREWWRDRFPVMDKQLGSEFREHADAIEREVEELREREYLEREVEELREREYRNGMEDGAMPAEHGWVRLPVDEDGDVLHIGELVDEKLPFGGYAAPAPIDTMELSRGASGYRWMVKLDAENSASISPKLLRHHHAPTVEDVLREFAEKVIDSQVPGVHPTYEEAIAEFAAKLRLVGDGE